MFLNQVVVATAVLIASQFHVCENNVINSNGYMSNYEWSETDTSNDRSGHSTSRVMENNNEGSKEIITTTVTRPGVDGKLVANITITTIQRDHDGNIIKKNVTNKIQAIDQIKPQECSYDSDCPDDKYCNFMEKCQQRKPLGKSCVRSGQCINGAKCIMGTCRHVQLTGKTGSYCEKDSECAQDHCCVENEDGGKCAFLAREGESCSNPNYDWFWPGKVLPENCPCESELTCEENWENWTFENTCHARWDKKQQITKTKKSKD